MSKYYSNDPYWMVARYPGKCAKTGEPFYPGDRIFYYPRDKKAYSGQTAEAFYSAFLAAVQDEDFYNSGF